LLTWVILGGLASANTESDGNLGYALFSVFVYIVHKRPVGVAHREAPDSSPV
jgi:hypothetical protein